MSITNLILILTNLFLSNTLPVKPTIKVDQQKITTPKTGIQDLIVTHYDCSPKHITNMQYYKLNRIGECKIKPADFQILPAQVQIFSQIRTIQVRAYAIYAKLSDKEVFCHKIALKRGYRFDHDNWYVNNMERPFFPTEIEARRELTRIGLKDKNNYRPQRIQFDILDDPHWQERIEEKQGRFQFNRSDPFAFQHGSLVYNPNDHNWIPQVTDNPWANCPGKSPQYEYHVIHTIGWTLQLTKITLTFDLATEHMYYGKDRIKCDIERGYCEPNHAIKAVVIWEPEHHCKIFDVGRSHARMIKFQKRYFIETLENNETIRRHQHEAHMYSSRFQKHLYDESALSRFEVLTKPLFKCNEDKPYYATQYQDIFIQYTEGFNFASGTPSSNFDDQHTIGPPFVKPPSVTPYTKARIQDGYVIPVESKLYRKSEKYEFFRKQNWFGAVHPNVQIDAKLDYMISRVLLEMDQTSLNIYKKLCDLDRDLKQTAFILLTQKFPLVGYVITGQRHTFATLKSQNVISLYQCKTVQSPLYVLKDQCFERIPIFYQNKVQFVDQVTRKTFPWSIKAPCKSDNFDQHISLDVDGDNTYRLTPHPIKAHNPVKIFTPAEVDNHFTHADFTAQQLGIYSQYDWTKSVDKMRFNQLVDDAAEKFEVARAVNFADLAKQAQLQAQFTRLRTRI